MSTPDGRSSAVLLAGTLQDAAVVVDARDRVLAWNGAAETGLGLSQACAGRTLQELGLAGRPGAVRMSLAPGAARGATADSTAFADSSADVPDSTADGATFADSIAIVAWRLGAAPSDEEIALEKGRALARLAPGVTHDMRNHLGGFKAFSALLRADEAAVADYGELLAQLEANSDRALQLLEAFALLARERDADPRPVQLASAVPAALVMAEYQLMNVARIVDLPERLPEVLADPLRLHQALAAVIVNALEGLGWPHAHGALSVSARPATGTGPHMVEIAFEDDAPTIPAPERAHLFDPQPPVGMSPRAGLDLAVARRLVEADGGTLRYEPGRSGGNRLVVTLPVAAALPDPAEPRAGPAPVAEPAPPPALTVLICDDDKAIRDLMARFLARAGIHTITAESGAEALAVLERERVDLVMSDHRMNEMSGIALHAAVAERHPHLRTRFILMSGDPGEAAIQAFASSTGLPVLAKPFTVAAVEDTIRSLMQG